MVLQQRLLVHPAWRWHGAATAGLHPQHVQHDAGAPKRRRFCRRRGGTRVKLLGRSCSSTAKPPEAACSHAVTSWARLVVSWCCTVTRVAMQCVMSSTPRRHLQCVAALQMRYLVRCFGLLPPAVEGLVASQCVALANAAGLTAQELGRETCAARKALDAVVKSGGHVKRTPTLCCACEAEFRTIFRPPQDSHTCGRRPENFFWVFSIARSTPTASNMMLVQRTRCSQRTWQQQRQLARPGAAVRPPRTSSFGSVASPAPLASTVVRALSDQSEREIEDMKQQAAGSDIWDSDVFATIFKAGFTSCSMRFAWKQWPFSRSTACMQSVCPDNSQHGALKARGRTLSRCAAGFVAAVQVIVVAGIASVTYLLANAAEPVIRSTINAFPHT